MFLHQYPRFIWRAANDLPEINEIADLVKPILDLDTRRARQREELKIEGVKEREIKQELRSGQDPPTFN